MQVTRSRSPFWFLSSHPQLTPAPVRPAWPWAGVCWVTFWALLSSLWCVTAAAQLSATFDEPVYLTEGLKRWRTGSTAGLMKLGTMPLPADVQTLPLYLWERWAGTPIDPVADFDKVLPWARAASLVFWWLLLAHAWLAAKSLGGRWAAAAAVAFLACEPTLLGHAALATTDIAVAACVLALVYHFRVNRERGWGWRIAWPALWFALAVLAKASGLVFGALCLFAVEAERCRWWRRGRHPELPRPRFLRSMKDFFQIGFIGMVLVFVWCGCDWRPEESFVEWAHGLPEGRFAAAMVWLSENLRIFSNAGEGLVRQVRHNLKGHGAYLLGNTHPRALWYYFPVAMTIKFTVPLLAAPLVLAAARRWSGGRWRWYGNWALLSATVLLVFSLACRVQIGVRFMFPLVALAVVGLAAALVRAARESGSAWSRRGLAAGAAAALAWTVAEGVAVWPHGLCYVNPLWGGTESGYKIVSEANYDWGQGLKELARWQEKREGGPLDVWYFGTDPSLARLPLRSLPLHVLPIHSHADARAHLRGRRVAVSMTLVYGNIKGTPQMRYVLDVLGEQQPAGRTTTFLIYDFTGEAGNGETTAKASP